MMVLFDQRDIARIRYRCDACNVVVGVPSFGSFAEQHKCGDIEKDPLGKYREAQVAEVPATPSAPKQARKPKAPAPSAPKATRKPKAAADA